MELWNEGFPRELASQSIDPDNLLYTCSELAKPHFETRG